MTTAVFQLWDNYFWDDMGLGYITKIFLMLATFSIHCLTLWCPSNKRKLSAHHSSSHLACIVNKSFLTDFYKYLILEVSGSVAL